MNTVNCNPKPKSAITNTSESNKDHFFLMRQGNVYRQPPYNIIKTEKEISIQVFAAGYDKDDLYIYTEQSTLWIQGKNVESANTPAKGKISFKLGNFKLGFQIENKYNLSKPSVVLKNGILDIRFPLNENFSRRIEIQ
jgi:HSP20 family molecular chaperone IbpA